MTPRKRSLDINKLAREDAERISDQIGAEVRKIEDEAIEKANELLNIYGMKAMMQIVIQAKDVIQVQPAQEAPKKKKGRPKKAANL